MKQTVHFYLIVTLMLVYSLVDTNHQTRIAREHQQKADSLHRVVLQELETIRKFRIEHLNRCSNELSQHAKALLEEERSNHGE